MRTPLGSEIYTVFDDGAGRMKLEFFARSGVFVHYAAKGSPVRVALRALRIWPAVKAICAALGYERIEAMFRDDRQLERLCEMCGFVLRARAGGITYMECANA